MEAGLTDAKDFELVRYAKSSECLDQLVDTYPLNVNPTTRYVVNGLVMGSAIANSLLFDYAFAGDWWPANRELFAASTGIFWTNQVGSWIMVDLSARIISDVRKKSGEMQEMDREYLVGSRVSRSLNDYYEGMASPLLAVDGSKGLEDYMGAFFVNNAEVVSSTYVVEKKGDYHLVMVGVIPIPIRVPSWLSPFKEYTITTTLRYGEHDFVHTDCISILGKPDFYSKGDRVHVLGKRNRDGEVYVSRIGEAFMVNDGSL